MAWDIGDTITRSVSLTTTGGAAVDADSTPTWTVTLPDGTAGVSPTVQHGGVGDYYVAYPAAVAGQHTDRWTATISGVPVVIGGAFRVRSGAPLIDLVEARALLGLGVDPIRDEALRDVLDAASGVVEKASGRTWRRTSVTETHRGSDSYTEVVLRRCPVMAVTTVMVGSIPTAAASWTVDTTIGILYPPDGTAWLGPVTVTYTAGTAVVPDDVLDACRLVVQQRWARRSGAAGAPRRAGGSPDGLDAQVREALAAISSLPGIA